MARTFTAPIPLAVAGTTGNVTGTAVALPGNTTDVAFVFTVEVAGGTPTVTFKFQGSFDGTTWFDTAYVTDANETLAVATRTVTAVGQSAQFMVRGVGGRKYPYYRVVTTANTNITFRAEAWPTVDA